MNRIKDLLRRHNRRGTPEALDTGIEGDGPSPVEAAIGTETAERYECALARLRPEDREAARHSGRRGHRARRCLPPVPARGDEWSCPLAPAGPASEVWASNTSPQDLFGFSIAVSGSAVIVGAVGEDSAATGINGDQTSNAAADSGAAYVFSMSAGNTDPGTDVSVDVDTALPNGSPTSVSLSFDQVTTGGETTVTTSAAGPPPPTGFKLTSPPVYYELGRYHGRVFS